MSRLRQLFDPVDIASLAFFRIALGLCLIVHIGPHVLGDSPYLETAAPAFRFTYPGLAWLPALPEEIIRLMLSGMFIAAFGIMLGFLFPLSCGFYAFGAAWFHFADPAKFHNFYYLIVLLTTLLAFMPAHGAASIDAWMRPALRRATTPRISVALLRFQVGIPFFFSGLSKLNAEWLHGFPSIYHWKSFVLAHTWAEALPEESMALLIAWAGALTDVSLLPLLFWRRTRAFGFFLAVVFNLGNALLFSGPAFGVAMFPWIMIAGVTIFLDPDWPRRVASWLRGRGAVKSTDQGSDPGTSASLGHRRSLTLGLIGLWVAVQVLVPLRYRLYPGDPLWTEEGRTHGWQMMAAYKTGSVRFLVTCPEGGTIDGPIEGTIDAPEAGETEIYYGYGPIAGRRYQVFQVHPALIFQYARHLKERRANRGQPGCEVRVDAIASLNGRPPQRLIDPTVDITAHPPRWGHSPWVLPLDQPRLALSEADWTFQNRQQEQVGGD